MYVTTMNNNKTFAASTMFLDIILRVLGFMSCGNHA